MCQQQFPCQLFWPLQLPVMKVHGKQLGWWKWVTWKCIWNISLHHQAPTWCSYTSRFQHMHQKPLPFKTMHFTFSPKPLMDFRKGFDMRGGECVYKWAWGGYGEHSVGFQQAENFKAEVSERVRIIPAKVKRWEWEKGSVTESEKAFKREGGFGVIIDVSNIPTVHSITHPHTVYRGQGK